MKLKPSPLRKLLLVFFLAVMAVAATALLQGERTLGWYLLALIPACFGLAALVMLVSLLLPDSSFLALTPAGLIIRSLYQDAFFAWSDIEGFFVENVAEDRRVRWRHAAGYQARARGGNLATRFAAFKRTLPDTYGYRADALAALLDGWRLKAAAAPPAAPTPGSNPLPTSDPLPPNRVVSGKTMTIQLEPQAGEIRQRRGVELLLAGREEEALVELQAAQALNPLSYGIHLDKTVALRALGRLPEALETCDAAMAVLVIPPVMQGLFHQLRGDVLHDLGRPEEALESFQRSLDLHPEARYDVYPRRQQALLLAELGRPQEAMAACEAAVRLHPDDEGLRELRSALPASGEPAG